jgi:Domain of unknown function (DUF4281)
MHWGVQRRRAVHWREWLGFALFLTAAFRGAAHAPCYRCPSSSQRCGWIIAMLDPDTVFKAASTAALLGWLALLLSPRSVRWARPAWRFSGRLLPLAFSALYVAMLAAHWRGAGGFGSASEVRALFDVPGVLVAGWVHYLAFDLFVGAWIAERGAALSLPHWQLVPVLLLTFLFGPAGLLAFVVLRALRQPASLQWQTGVAP